MKKITLSIGGMSCSACSTGLEKHLKKCHGIKDASVNLVLANASIEYDDDITIEMINNYIKDAGFKSLGIYSENKEDVKQKGKVALIIFTILSIILLYVSMSHMVHLPVIPFLHMEKYPLNYALCLLILTIPYLIYGFDIFKNGYKNLIHRTPNMDTLVSIGVLSSFIYSLFGTIMIIMWKNHYVHNLYYESAGIVIYFIKLGRYIDFKSKEKTKESIKELVTITPSMALLRTKDGEKEVTLDEIKKGDILICKSGTKVAVDGTIVDGNAHFDESFITGESKPVKKGKNASVVAGSLNIDGYILYEADRIGKDSTISEIVKLVVEATNTKAPIAKVADKVSGIFVPSIMLISFFTFIIYLILGFPLNTALTHFVTVLVVACPCALGLATPLAIVISEGMCAKNGILVKESATLENAHKMDTIVFDKTGTLTYGQLSISKVYNYSNYSDKKMLKIVASLEEKSTHPIAKAFKINEKLLDVDNYQNIDGMGLYGQISNNEYYVGNNKILKKIDIKNHYEKDEQYLKQNGNSIVYLIENKHIIALIGVKDVIRENAKEVIQELKELNKEVIMLSGDNEMTASIVASELGIDNVFSNMMPADKAKKIKELINSGKKVMMMGDGINDAPSLATANIGVSISSGTDIAKTGADVILMNNNLRSLINLINISKKTIRNIKQNLFWAFFYNVCMIPIAIGILSKFNINMNPMVAGFAMTISSLTVMFNALRLKKIKLRRD